MEVPMNRRSFLECCFLAGGMLIATYSGFAQTPAEGGNSGVSVVEQYFRSALFGLSDVSIYPDDASARQLLEKIRNPDGASDFYCAHLFTRTEPISSYERDSDIDMILKANIAADANTYVEKLTKGLTSTETGKPTITISETNYAMLVSRAVSSYTSRGEIRLSAKQNGNPIYAVLLIGSIRISKDSLAEAIDSPKGLNGAGASGTTITQNTQNDTGATIASRRTTLDASSDLKLLSQDLMSLRNK
jgi:hypothetical protein